MAPKRQAARAVEDAVSAYVSIELLDSESSVVVTSAFDYISDLRSATTANTAGVLLAAEGARTPYEAAPGAYPLRVLGRNAGDCDGNVQYQIVHLGHLVIPNA